LVGAELPGGLKIKKAALRGVESHGMLCSAKELGMAESSEGLMILAADAQPGADVRQVLACDDVTIELGLTPNRADCLSIAGIAREVAALNRISARDAAPKETPPAIAEHFPVLVETKAGCARYVGRVIKNVDARAPTPLWMRERLRRCGVRSIAAVVDVTNYVMLEYGQPMHAFDLAKLSGGIVVRKAVDGEKITLLDGREIELTSETLVIADHKHPQALAGIMGGLNSSVTDGTRDIFLESAFFAPTAIAGRARAYGMHTDSSHRFERGVDPTLQRRAIERATELIQQIAGGRTGPITDVSYDAELPRRTTITLRRARIERVLGVAIADAQVSDILTRLGMTVAANNEGWTVVPPSFRFDVAMEIDLIEELARVYGYDKVPNRQPVATLAMRPSPESSIGLGDVRNVLVQRGYHEVITYSFVDPALQQAIDPARTPIMLANPIASDMSAMRTSTWPGLVNALKHNLHRRQERVRIFESGMRFLRDGQATTQDTVIGGLVTGRVEAEQWSGQKRDADFYDVKSDVEQVLQLVVGAEAGFVRREHPALHPGRCAAIVRGDRVVGWIGELHPAAAKKLDLDAGVYLFELEFDALRAARARRYREISRFPSIRRDIAIVVDEGLPYADVERQVRDAAPALLAEFQLFDVYIGKGIESGRKSLAIGLTFQALDRTLSDGDVDHDLQKILALLEKNFGARLRS
jgi:phenylalanyl-tRNA synthetase beta chain